ncbi:neurexin protein binding [Homalodisca vitripennis]|nr:neurexin protein binding [Homalodisca vitripennis]
METPISCHHRDGLFIFGFVDNRHSQPASRGLFHRAILLSGSALSSWALVEDPIYFAVRLDRQVKCSVPEDLLRDNEDIVDCLRDVHLQELLKADTSVPLLSDRLRAERGRRRHPDRLQELLMNYLPDFPGLTGTSVFNYKRGENLFGRKKYDLMLGVITRQSLARFPFADIKSGFGSRRRDKILRLMCGTRTSTIPPRFSPRLILPQSARTYTRITPEPGYNTDRLPTDYSLQPRYPKMCGKHYVTIYRDTLPGTKPYNFKNYA